MKKLLYVCLAIVLASCTKNQEEEFSAINMDNVVSFAVVNANNEDLLDSSNPNAIDLTTLRVYYLIDGVKTAANTGSDNPNGFYKYRVKQANDSYKYRLRVFLNPTVTNQQPKNTTIIEWNNANNDTLEARYRVYKNSPVSLLEFWENGQSRWKVQDQNTNPTRLITLVK
ncbi:hypothetical protein [Polaribacter pacificus]|nr:hypothetical protein [Polaribacter pacificus]